MAGDSSPGPTRRPRVVLLAEQRLVGEAVRAALSSRSMDVVVIEWPGPRRPVRTVRRRLASLRPSAGIVFGDLKNPRMRADARLLVSMVPLPWVLVVSHHDDVSWGDLVGVGATLVPASISLDDLSQNLMRLMSGVDLMSSAAREQMMHDWRLRRDELDEVAERLARLTPREGEVLDLLAAGRSVKEIAVAGEVSEATVRTQVKAVLRKLEVNSQLAAVALVRRARPADLTPRSVPRARS